MMTRRSVLAGVGAVGASVLGTSVLGAQARGKSPAPETRRPPQSQRHFVSPAVESCIQDMRRRIADPLLAQLFENCFPNTLDTTVLMSAPGGVPDTFVLTGDIHAMWLRDSSEQVRPYLPLARQDAALQRMYRGLIARQARSILIDPYANAFMQDPKSATNLSWAQQDMTQATPGVAERKWELDSPCHVIRLSHDYWRATGDLSPFDATWRDAMGRVLTTLRAQQRKTDKGPYHFQRVSESPLDTLPLDGYGAPTRKVGLIHSGFRASDDACTYPFHIPDNLFAVVALRQLVAMAKAVSLDAALVADANALADEVAAAAAAHGKVRLPGGELVWAYEVDGFGNALFMDDANVPGLLSLPYLGVCSPGDALYQATRRAVLSDADPYFFKGKAAEGVGGPHVGLDMIWPMSIIMRAMTSTDDAEILSCLAAIKRSSAGTGFLHEAFQKDNPQQFTRPWFAWVNSLFGALILDLAARKPNLLRQP